MQLQIQGKCKQNWTEMSEVNSHQKFCNVCSNCVYDLDHYSFKELKTFLIEHPTACVKIKTRNVEQFNSYEASKSITNQSKRWLQLSSLVGFLYFSTIAKAQTKNDSIVVQGLLYDTNGFPISDAKIYVKESKEISITDQDGKFQLKVPLNKDLYELEYVEYKNETIQFFSFSNPEICQKIISKNEASEVSLGAVVVSYYRTPNILQKVGRTIAWPFKQIGKLF